MGRNSSAQVYPQHILSDEEWVASVSRLGISIAEGAQALINRDEHPRRLPRRDEEGHPHRRRQAEDL
jgi:hypothetical protein